jgi:hypothetical protein
MYNLTTRTIFAIDKISSESVNSEVGKVRGIPQELKKI